MAQDRDGEGSGWRGIGMAWDQDGVGSGWRGIGIITRRESSVCATACCPLPPALSLSLCSRRASHAVLMLVAMPTTAEAGRIQTTFSAICRVACAVGGALDESKEGGVCCK